MSAGGRVLVVVLRLEELEDLPWRTIVHRESLPAGSLSGERSRAAALRAAARAAMESARGRTEGRPVETTELRLDSPPGALRSVYRVHVSSQSSLLTWAADEDDAVLRVLSRGLSWWATPTKWADLDRLTPAEAARRWVRSLLRHGWPPALRLADDAGSRLGPDRPDREAGEGRDDRSSPGWALRAGGPIRSSAGY
jgi:hypothetical protein